MRRTRDAEDERRVLVALTDSGRALRDDAAGVPERVRCAAGMTADEAGAERARLVALRDRLQAWLEEK